MSTSLFEKIILFVLAGLVSFLAFLNQEIRLMHDDVLIVKNEFSHFSNILEKRGEKMTDFDKLLKQGYEWRLRHEFKGHEE